MRVGSRAARPLQAHKLFGGQYGQLGRLGAVQAGKFSRAISLRLSILSWALLPVSRGGGEGGGRMGGGGGVSPPIRNLDSRGVEG